jgi:hypothetical protein
MKIISSIIEKLIIRKILVHLKLWNDPQRTRPPPFSRSEQHVQKHSNIKNFITRHLTIAGTVMKSRFSERINRTGLICTYHWGIIKLRDSFLRENSWVCCSNYLLKIGRKVVVLARGVYMLSTKW